MGGMFSVVKVRVDVKRGDYSDPGPYQHPPGTLAREYTADPDAAPRAAAPKPEASTWRVRKPGPHEGH